MTNKSAIFETLFTFSHQHVNKIFIKMHSIENRCVIGPENILFCFQVHACIFQSVIFTFCGREGVKWILLYRLSWCWSTWNFSQSFVTCGRLSSMNRQSLDDNPYGRCEGETKLTFGNTGVWQYWNSLIMTLLQQSPALNTSVYHWAMARSEVLYIQVLILNARNYIYIYANNQLFTK